MRADARRNREKVLEVARQVFSTDGTGVPLDDIAEKAGVGAGTVYRHFPTKESLIQAVLESRIELLTGRAQLLSETEPPGQALELFIFEMLCEGGEKRDLTDALINVGVDLGTSLASVHSDLQRAMGLLLQQAQHAGTVRSDIDVDDLMALVTGVLIALHRGHRRPHFPERSLKVLLDGLRTGA
jgi:AcrR family transcriptional regulator